VVPRARSPSQAAVVADSRGSSLGRQRARSGRQRGGAPAARPVGLEEPVRGVAQVAHELGPERLDLAVVWRGVGPDGLGPAVGRG
jgi:hypothetical protein